MKLYYEMSKYPKLGRKGIILVSRIQINLIVNMTRRNQDLNSFHFIEGV